MLCMLRVLVSRATPLLVVGGALAVLLVYRQQLELDRPVSLLFLSRLRNAVGFGRDRAISDGAQHDRTDDVADPVVRR